MPKESNPRFGTVQGINTIVWACSLYPLMVIWLIYMVGVIGWLLYGHQPHDYLADDPHPQFILALRSYLAFIGWLCVYACFVVLPLNAFFIVIELVQRVLHRQRGIVWLLAIPILLWSLSLASFRWQLVTLP